MTSLKIRPAHEGDVQIIVKYNTAMAKETEGIDLPLDVIAQGVASVINGRAAAAACYYLVEKDGEVIAQLMITKEWSDWRNTEVWWIQSVYVHPDHRKNGHYKSLYNYVKAEAERQGAAGLRLYVDINNNHATATYEKMGMKSHYRVFEDMFTEY